MQIGPYRVESQIGEGGMGTVHRAVDTRLNRVVAIKFLSRDLADATARHRFQREAQTASSLNHPHILTVHDVGDFDGRQYLVTEYVDGGTLQQWARAEKREWPQIVELLSGVADGLAAAHDAGITHRDIKPANILVAKNGYAKLADFGLAKLIEREQDVTHTVDSDRTRAGVIVGTVSYMSPEQAAGLPVDARSDIFSFGAVLYELLSGRKPFQGAADIDVLHAVRHRPPAPLDARLPAALRVIVDRALEKDPADRYQSMRDLVIDLRRVVRQTGEFEPGVAASQRRHTMAWAAGALGVALTIALAAVMWFRPETPAAPQQPQYTALTNYSDSVVAPALSPDGKFLSFIRSGDTFWGFGEVFVKALPDGEPVQLTRDGQRKIGPAVFSADGTRVAYTVAVDDKWDTWTVPILTREPTRLLANATALTWTPSSAGPPALLFSSWLEQRPRMALYASGEHRTNLREVYLPEDVNGMVHRAYLSPDARSVLLIEMDASGWVPCRVIPFDGSSRGQQVGPARAQCTDGAWSPDGKAVYLSAKVDEGFHLWRQSLPGGKPEQLTFGATEEEGVAVSPDGGSLVTSVGTSRSTLWVHDARGDRQITTEGHPAQASFSPDGTRVYFVSSPAPLNFISSEGSLHVVDLKTDRVERLLPDLRMVQYDISRDGSKVLFVKAEASGRSTLWLATLDGTSPPRQLSSADPLMGLFGANGEVLFAGGEGPTKYLYRIKEDGSGLTKVLADPIIALYDVSPDGRWAAVWSGKAAAVYPIDGGAPIVMCPACASRPPIDQPPVITWSADGKFVYLHEPGLRQTIAVPLKPGQVMPEWPAAGFPSPLAATSLPGATVLAAERAVGGPDPSLYAFAKVTTNRNIYRIVLP